MQCSWRINAAIKRFAPVAVAASAVGEASRVEGELTDHSDDDGEVDKDREGPKSHVRRHGAIAKVADFLVPLALSQLRQWVGRSEFIELLLRRQVGGVFLLGLGDDRGHGSRHLSRQVVVQASQLI